MLGMHTHPPLNAGGGESKGGMTETAREEDALPSSPRCFRGQVGVFRRPPAGALCTFLRNPASLFLVTSWALPVRRRQPEPPTWPLATLAFSIKD